MPAQLSTHSSSRRGRSKSPPISNKSRSRSRSKRGPEVSLPPNLGRRSERSSERHSTSGRVAEHGQMHKHREIPTDPGRYQQSIILSPVNNQNSSEINQSGSFEQTSKVSDESQERGKGARFSIGLGSHSISGGIHFGKNKNDKNSPQAVELPPLLNISGSKSVKEDPLAYGSFTPDHLVYPTSPKRRNHVETRRGETPRPRPSSLRYDDVQPIPAPTSAPKQIHDGPIRHRDSSPNPSDLTRRIQSLGVSAEYHTGTGSEISLVNSPGSPLLESYHGTYQSISPMPSPPLIASHYPSPPNIDSLSCCYSSADERSVLSTSKKPRRTARFHDPKEEASILAQALSGEKTSPDTTPLISILPGLTHTQVLELRSQYKRIVKTGPENKAVNIAKHIKMRLKDQPGLMKACYVCALGRWESEAYWANYWYQSQKNRGELLIESLMGRTNEEIRSIKSAFRDKKYQNSLTKCLETEMPQDKFKKAVMLVLEEKRMEEQPDGRVDSKLIDVDVQDLRDAVKSKRGGESAVIQIVISRSETHLREVLKAYNVAYGKNFAKEMLKKSENIVGELLAHIINGIINAPVRDALLLHHALTLIRSDPTKSDLLISRLVRYHWDRPHLERVRTEFRHHYNAELQTVVTENVSDDLGLFLEGLCVRRVEGDVRVLNP